MRKYIFLALISITILVTPVGLNAAYDDVTLTTDTVISVNGINLNVSGSSAVIESMVVNETNFTVTLQTNSTFQVTSSDRKTIDFELPSPIQSSRPCTSTESSLILGGADGVTVTITPNSNACDSTATTGSSGGSSSGGGGSASSPGVVVTTSSQVTDTVSETTEETGTVSTVASSSSLTQGQIDSIIDLLKAFGAEQSVIDNVILSLSGSGSSVAASKPSGVSAVFSSGLSRGSSNSDIKRLQQLLNSDPDTTVAASGVGSSGNETNYFGSLTEKAVQKFQMKHGIVSSPSDAGYGYVGPKTRAKLSEVFGQ